jgi:uncharacterized protein (TIGR04255 family)
MARIPKRLKRDPIVEAILEIRFKSEDVSEVVVGKLAAHSAWGTGTTVRLPVADIPEPIRSQDPTLQSQPILELRPASGGRIIKVGERVVSYHAVKPYPGWAVFEGELAATIDTVFATIKGLQVTRLGFRYINAFTKDDHAIESVRALNLRIEIADLPVPPPLNLNYSHKHDDQHVSLIRIASTEFSAIPGVSPTAVADIDIFTPDVIEIGSSDAAKLWTAAAHARLKEEFFNLFTKQMFDSLVAEW